MTMSPPSRASRIRGTSCLRSVRPPAPSWTTWTPSSRRRSWRISRSPAEYSDQLLGQAVERRESEDGHEDVVEILSARELDVLDAPRHHLGRLPLSVGRSEEHTSELQ